MYLKTHHSVGPAPVCLPLKGILQSNQSPAFPTGSYMGKSLTFIHFCQGVYHSLKLAGRQHIWRQVRSSICSTHHTQQNNAAGPTQLLALTTCQPCQHWQYQLCSRAAQCLPTALKRHNMLMVTHMHLDRLCSSCVEKTACVKLSQWAVPGNVLTEQQGCLQAMLLPC